MTAETVGTTIFRDKGHRPGPPRQVVDRARRDLWRPDPMGRDLPVPDLLDPHDEFQAGAERDAGGARPVTWTISRRGWGGGRWAYRPTPSEPSRRRAHEFMKRFMNSVIVSVTASTLAVALGTPRRLRAVAVLLPVGLDEATRDISFFFLSQLILPPVVLALPFLVLYKAARTCWIRGSG